MHQQLVVVLLVGLAASAYGLDLSHAAKRSTEIEPRIFNIISDLYAQVIYPPLNHVVTSLALMGAQVLAGIHQNGIPAPNGRILHPSEAELRGFWDDLWNHGVRPSVENALSGLSLMTAQLLAGIGSNGVNLGKRDMTEAQARDFLDDLWNNGIKEPAQNALSGLALMLAQVLAGIGSNGVSLGKRDLAEADMRIFDILGDAISSIFTNAIKEPLENALASSALMLAQVLAGMGTNGINLSSIFGRSDLSQFAGRQAELRGFFDSLADGLINGLQSVWSNVFQGPVQNALSSSALMAAQVLAGIGTNGIDLSAIGRR